jgi:peptide-methionine (S)-S-oxide reductase
MLFMRKTTALPSAAEALPGRAQAIPTATTHFVNGHKLKPPYPEGLEQAYAGGHTPNPTYEEVCSGRTGHTEVVLVVFDPKKVSYDRLLKAFWENHNPTQGMRQGNDVGTQYRSAIYTFNDAQRKAADASKAAYQKALSAKGLPTISTEIQPAGEFYFAEDYHQQYLAKNPAGYCGLGGTGVSCPIGAGVSA